MKTLSPLKAIRAKCLDCCGGRPSVVRHCTCNGQTSTECALWPYRFGIRPGTARKRYGADLLDPKKIPDADVEPRDCEAAMAAEALENPVGGAVFGTNVEKRPYQTAEAMK